MRSLCASLLCLLAAGCERAERTAAQPLPASVERPLAANQLGVVRFTPETAQRLGLGTARVARATVPPVRTIGGEVIVPPGRTSVVTAPVSGELRAASPQASLTPGTTVRRAEPLLKLIPFASIDRDVHARAEREVAASAAQLAAADARVTRLSQTGAEQAVSRRAYEEAVAARDILRADVRAAETRAESVRSAPLLSDVALTIKAPNDGVVRALSVVPGQAISAGAALLELVAVEALQVRVPVYAGDLSRLDAAVNAQVRALSSPIAAALAATAISGPPTAAPERATVDRYFALPREASFSPGERVLVELALRGEQNARSVPQGAVLYDAAGSAWVYACRGQNAFQRERIDPIRLVRDDVVFTNGPALDSCVASVGTVAIYGTEFEPGH